MLPPGGRNWHRDFLFDIGNNNAYTFKYFAPLNLPEIQAETHKPALRLPEGLFVVPNPNVEAPVVLHPKPELVPNPSGGR